MIETLEILLTKLIISMNTENIKNVVSISQLKLFKLFLLTKFQYDLIKNSSI